MDEIELIELLTSLITDDEIAMRLDLLLLLNFLGSEPNL